jgi:hypothetical protein
MNVFSYPSIGVFFKAFNSVSNFFLYMFSPILKQRLFSTLENKITKNQSVDKTGQKKLSNEIEPSKHTVCRVGFV